MSKFERHINWLPPTHTPPAAREPAAEGRALDLSQTQDPEQMGWSGARSFDSAI